MAELNKNARIWIWFAISFTLYLIWKFAFHFWPMDRLF